MHSSAAGSFEADLLLAPAVAPMSGPPLWPLAKLTYCCPLHYAFCSDPVDYAWHDRELSIERWYNAFIQARALGAMQLGSSGGGPLLRRGFETLVAHVHGFGFYVNLVTSGMDLTDARLDMLRVAGFDRIQLSFQDSMRELNGFLSSTHTFGLKYQVTDLIKAHGCPIMMNCVIYRHNLPHVGAIIDTALEIDVEYLELANTRYYGWAWEDRLAPIPALEQLRDAEAVVNDHRTRIGSRCRLLHVVPGYSEQRPKKRMNGWGTIFLGIALNDVTLPRHSARMLPGLELFNVLSQPLRDIWRSSNAFQHFRDIHRMPGPCQSCESRKGGAGGCHCQAYLLTGDATRTDPVCGKLADHGVLQQVVLQGRVAAMNGFGQMRDTRAGEVPIVFRTNTNSHQLTQPQNVILEKRESRTISTLLLFPGEQRRSLGA